MLTHSLHSLPQLMLTLPLTVTYASITDQLSRELDTPLGRLKIKHGFPPKVLQAPADDVDGDDVIVPIQHGDRLSVEIAPEPGIGESLA